MEGPGISKYRSVVHTYTYSAPEHSRQNRGRAHHQTRSFLEDQIESLDGSSPRTALERAAVESSLSLASLGVLTELSTGVVKRRHEVTEQVSAHRIARATVVVLQFREDVGGVHHDHASMHQTQYGYVLVERAPRPDASMTPYTS